MSDNLLDLHPDTLAIRYGQVRTNESEHSEPIFATSSYVFESAAEAAARFSGDQPGNIYSRFTNPTVASFERRLAALEGGSNCIATASGMAAITSVVLGLLRTGDHVVASAGVFGSTVTLFNKIFSRFGVSCSWVALDDHAAWAAATNDHTRMFFLETPSNPLCQIADIQAIADIAHQVNALLVVDNAFCTPILQQPLQLGADVVVHTATKYLDGQGRCVGGAVVTSNQDVYDEIYSIIRTAGPSMSPFNAWVFSKGLETLGLRMRQHCDNAARLAAWLEQQPAVEKVYYPGLVSHPQHELASRQQSGYGGIVSFDVSGGKQAAWQVIDSTQLLSITANLGDVKSTITHPATTTHYRITQQERDYAGIRDSLLRVSVGLEHVDDIINDLKHGLEKL